MLLTVGKTNLTALSAAPNLTNSGKFSVSCRGGSFGRDIDANSVQDADVLIVRSRTKVNQALLQDSQVKFNNITFFSTLC
jgi:hypothetical protein